MSEMDPGLTADPGLEADPAAAAEAPWAPSQDEWQQIAGAVGYLAELEQKRSAVYAPQDEEQTPELNPFDPSFVEQLRGMIHQEVAPIAGRFQEMSAEESEAQIKDILSDYASRDGEFDIGLARARARDMAPAFFAKYGKANGAAEKLLEQAANEQRAWEAQFAESAVNRHTNRLSTLAGAPGEPGSQYAVGAQTREMPDYRKGGSVTQRFFGPNGDAA